MSRKIRSEYVYFRHEGAETREVFFRINPLAIRFQQANKGSVVDTLGGYFREVFYSQDRQYNGLLLPDLVIEAETGIAYRQELKTMDWIWRHHGQPKADGSPADTYFYDLIQVGPFQSIERDQVKAFLVEILNFAWDETVQDPYRIRFTFRCKILRDFTWNGSEGGGPSGAGQIAGIPVGGFLGQLPGLGALLSSVSSQVDGILTGLDTALDAVVVPQDLQAALDTVTEQITQIQDQVTDQPALLSEDVQSALDSLQHGLTQAQAGILDGALDPSTLQNGIDQLQGSINTLNESLGETVGAGGALIPPAAPDVGIGTGIEPPTFDVNLVDNVFAPAP
jgi:hypothetical protein